tara:strand:+ start:196 stop:387 length:192 start_codon:yes stop_codon:yes gene_type:complete
MVINSEEHERLWNAIHELRDEIKELSTNVALIGQEISFFRKAVYALIALAGASLGVDTGMVSA